MTTGNSTGVLSLFGVYTVNSEKLKLKRTDREVSYVQFKHDREPNITVVRGCGRSRYHIRFSKTRSQDQALVHRGPGYRGRATGPVFAALLCWRLYMLSCKAPSSMVQYP